MTTTMIIIKNLNIKLFIWSILSIVLDFIYPYSYSYFYCNFITYEMNIPCMFIIGNYIWISFWSYIICVATSDILKLKSSNVKRIPTIISWLSGLGITYLLEFFLGNTNDRTIETMFDDSIFYISPIVGIIVCLFSYLIIEQFYKKRLTKLNERKKLIS